ncbi:phosphotriesterase [Phormidium tenue FACHB-886]|nr:phosphotriesterase [Phormidium tenue FACHB-886]
MTVLGPIAPEQMGITLMHEHLLLDATPWFWQRAKMDAQMMTNRVVSIEILGALRNDPFRCEDNCRLDNEQTAIEEVSQFRDKGGQTIVDATCRGVGRNPQALQRIAQATGLHIVMGAGYYLESAHPPQVKQMSIEAIAQEIEQDILEGVDGVRAGIIGEIGISKDFTNQEEKVLRAAARAQARTRVPLEVHLPGWERLGGRVLDVVAEEGADLRHTILCHMNPSGSDLDYQLALADRGAWLEYDMIGMDFYFAEQSAQSPCDQENAGAIARLKESGFLGQILLSQDVFVKIQLVRYGGTGYAHILDYFVPRLYRHGFTKAETNQLLIENPKCVFASSNSLKIS